MTIYICDLAQSLDASLTFFKRIEFQGVDLDAKEKHINNEVKKFDNVLKQ
jgi:hypothetical protein